MKIRAFALIAALAIPTVALADTPKNNPNYDKTTDNPNKPTTDKDKTKLSDADVQILAHQHHVNLMEIDMGKLAQTKGTAAVKKYGEMLVKDHQQADKDALAFAKKHGTAMIPKEKPATDAEKQEDKDMMDQAAHLKTLKGADFDKDFLTMMVAGHEKELAKIDVAMGQTTDSDLKDMLSNVKPVLQRHADQARDLQKSSPSASIEPSQPTPTNPKMKK